MRLVYEKFTAKLSAISLSFTVALAPDFLVVRLPLLMIKLKN